MAAAQALGRSGAHVVVSSRRQANVDKAVSLLRSENIQVTGTTCNVGNKEDREKLINLVRLFDYNEITLLIILEKICDYCVPCRLWISVVVLTYWSLMQL